MNLTITVEDEVLKQARMRALDENTSVNAILRKHLDHLCAFRVRPLHAALVRAAASRSASSKLSYWNALIVETALDAGAGVLLTEDLQHGQTFDRLRITNPFREEQEAAGH